MHVYIHWHKNSMCIEHTFMQVADIVCFSTSAEALYHILNETDLITWGRRQMVECVETAHADYLLSHLEPQGTSRMESLGECHPCYLPGPLQGEDRYVYVYVYMLCMNNYDINFFVLWSRAIIIIEVLCV